MIRLAIILALATAAPALAAPWQFEAPIDVIAARAGVFPHLSGAGRRHVAVHGQTVVVTWEDNRSRQPQIHAALRQGNRKTFATPIRLSAGLAAFEPSIVSHGHGLFVIAWEQDEAIYARILDARGRAGPPLRLAEQGAQVTLASHDGRIYAVWSEPHGRNRRLQMMVITTADRQLKPLSAPVVIEAAPPDGATPAFPSVAVTGAGIAVAWEDRRNVSSAIYFSHSADGRAFSRPQLLNERVTPQPGQRYGKGTTAMRVVLTATGDRGVAATWLDKRTLGNGFDTYAAFSLDGGRSFGRNQKVQDDFANKLVQINAVITARPGLVAVLWNDDRDGSQDLWLSWPNSAGGWEENLAVPGASGPGEQTDPAVVMDGEGHLHLVWLERQKPGGPVRLRYLRARYPGR